MQAVRTLTLHEPTTPLAVQYRLLKTRRGPGRATIATARKLLEILWRVITTNGPYRQLMPDLYQRKPERLQTAA